MFNHGQEQQARTMIQNLIEEDEYFGIFDDDDDLMIIGMVNENWLP